MIVKRYIIADQQKRDIYGVTEDDVMEIRQDISSLRYELISILKKNGMRTPQLSEEDAELSRKKDKIIERRILGDFCTEGDKSCPNLFNLSSHCLFDYITKMIKGKSRNRAKDNWSTLVQRYNRNQSTIDSSKFRQKLKQKRQMLPKNISIEFERHTGKITSCQRKKY